MDYLISVSFGELTLKGDNRKDFENRIIRKIKKAIADFEVEEFYKEQGKVFSSFIPKSLTKTLVASLIFSSFFSVLKTSQI